MVWVLPPWLISSYQSDVTESRAGKNVCNGPCTPVQLESLQEGDAFPNLSPKAVTKAAGVCLRPGSLKAKSEMGFLTSPGETW